MKRIFSLFLSSLLIISLVSCTRISIESKSDATLRFKDPNKNDAVEISQVLTEEEADEVKSILKGATYLKAGAGCPFNGEECAIVIGHQIFAIATDDCHTIHDVNEDKHYKIKDDEDWQYIVSLFEKYVGYSI